MELRNEWGAKMVGRHNIRTVFGVFLVLGGMVAAASRGQAQPTPLTWVHVDNGALNGAIHGLGPDQLDRFMGWCEAGDPGKVFIRFEGDHSTVAMGENATFGVQGSAGSVQEMFGLTGGASGPQFYAETRVKAPFWRVLSGSRHVVLSTKGAVVAVLNNIDNNAVKAFLANCTPAAAAAPAGPQPGPVVQQPQPQPAAPQPQPNAGGQGNDVGKAIALGALAAGAAIIAGKLADQALTEAPPPAAPAGASGRTVSVRVMSVHAISTTFGIGGDEIFLLASNGQRFPPQNNSAKSIDAGQTWAPSAPFSAQGGLSVDLREYDSISASDLIGNFAVNDNVAPGRYTATLRGGGGVYQVTYDVAATGRPQRQQPAPRVDNPRRVWAAHGQGSDITVTDCRDDCEEDIGIIFMCRGQGQPASVDVPWVALESAQEGEQRPLAVVVDGKRFDYTATLGGPGLVGHVPSFTIGPNDPLIDALQSGRVAQVQFDGSGVNIGLRGSRSAIDIFKAHCGWNGAAASVGGGPTPAPADQPLWFASSYTGENGQPVQSLTFGVPETDASLFNATCTPGGGEPTVALNVDLGNREDGQRAPVILETSSGTFAYNATVFISSGGESAGVRLRLPLTDPVWQAMQGERGPVSFSIVGAQKRNTSAIGAFGAFGQFLNACLTAAAADGIPSADPNAPPAVQPPAVDAIPPADVTAVPADVTAVPVDAAAVPADATPPVDAAAAAAQAPDAGSAAQAFSCDDGSTLSVSIVPAGQASVANVALADGTQVALIGVPSAVGTKYSNGAATLVVNGNSAQWVSGGAPKFCVGQ